MQRIDARWLTALIESSEDAIVSTTLEGIVVSWNRGAQRLFGYPAEEMIGRPISTIVPPERRRDEEQSLSVVGRGERVEQYETVRVRKDGRPVDVWVTLSPIMDDAGRVIGISKITYDITARKRMETASRERRRWLEGMLTSLGEGVLAVDNAGRISFMNPVAEQLTGWRQDAVLGRPIESVVWLVEETTRRRVDNAIIRALTLGQTTTLDHRAVLISRDGSEAPVEATAAAIHDEAGAAVGAIMVLHDVTELRRARQVQSRLAAIVESTDDAIISKTLDGVVTSWNPGAERIFGYTAAEMIGRPILVIFPPERLPEETRFLARLLRGARVEHYETVRIRKDGTAIDVSVTLSPITDAAGRVTGVAKVARDITESKRFERDRAELLRREQRALKDSVEAHRIKDEFLATLSHELRTPVNAILGWAQLIASGAVSMDNAEKAISVIKRNAEFQSRLIDDLLDLSSITVGKVRLDIGPINLADVLEAAVESIRPSAAAKNLELAVRVPPGAVPVMGDRQRLQQVIWNVLSNALKFTPAAGRVNVELSRTESFARLVVSDTGVGIPADLVPLVFDRFRQADGSATRRFGGLGLGLAIVRHLVELHGGSVWCASEGVGRGATFRVEIPLHRGHVHGIPAIVRTLVPVGQDSLAGLRALVVDDDRDGRELLAQALKSAGAAVRDAASASEATALAGKQAFDVILADIAMPNVDGYELLRGLRRRGDGTPAIAVSAFVTDADRQRALDAGFQRHLAKPVMTDELVRAVADVTGSSRGRSLAS